MKVYCLYFICAGLVLTPFLSCINAQSEPTNEEIFNHAIQAIRDSDYERAIIYFDKILDADPGNKVALSNKGSALIELGRYEEAITNFDQILNSEPKDVAALSNKGVALVKQERFNEAISSFEKVLQIDPTNQKALENLKVAFSKLGTQPIKNSKYLVDVLTTVRNSKGMLVSVTKSDAVSFRNHPLTDEFLENYPIDSLIKIKDDSYEKRTITTRYISLDDGFVSTARLNSEKFNDSIVVFSSLNHAHTVEAGDVISAKWTVFRLVN